MPRQGRARERVVEAIERTLLTGHNVKIESPGFLPDKTTGQSREFDVLLTVEMAHHRYHTGIEVRDRGRKVDAPQVEGFATKCSDTQVQSRVMVSASGFLEPALAKAKAHNIRCLELSQVEAHPWWLAPGFTEIRMVSKKGHVDVFAADEAALQAELAELGLAPGEALIRLFDRHGNEVPRTRLLNAGWQVAQQPTGPPRPPGTNQTVVVDLTFKEDDPLFMTVREGARRHQVGHARAQYLFDVVHELRPADALVYREVDGDLTHAEIVLSPPTEAGGRRVRVGIGGKPDGPKQMFVITEDQSRRRDDQ